MTGIVVAEWMEAAGGAEKVTNALLELAPGTELFCLWDDREPTDSIGRVTESRVGGTPLRNRKAAAAMLAPAIWRNLPSREAEWILCSSHSFAHQARFRGPARGARKMVYLHTPARYLWEPTVDGRGQHPLVDLVRPGYAALDARRAREIDLLATNSEFVRDRTRRVWGIDSHVIYPPVEARAIADGEGEGDLTDAERSLLRKLPDQFILGASRFVPYKRVDLAVAAAEAAGLPVVLAGGGPLEREYRAALETSRVFGTMIQSPSSALLHALYRRAAVYMFPPIEDFGIMPVEAMAAGAPVICSDQGGATESVVDGLTGIHVADFEPATLKTAVEEAMGLNRADIVRRALNFDTAEFSAHAADFFGLNQ